MESKTLYFVACPDVPDFSLHMKVFVEFVLLRMVLIERNLSRNRRNIAVCATVWSSLVVSELA